MVTAYLVRYRITEDAEVESSDRRVRRNANNLSMVIETTDTNIMISDLDPRIVYAVSVAARTDAGVGNYSHETIVPCRLINGMATILCIIDCILLLLTIMHAVAIAQSIMGRVWLGDLANWVKIAKLIALYFV